MEIVQIPPQRRIGMALPKLRGGAEDVVGPPIVRGAEHNRYACDDEAQNAILLAESQKAQMPRCGASTREASINHTSEQNSEPNFHDDGDHRMTVMTDGVSVT